MELLECRRIPDTEEVVVSPGCNHSAVGGPGTANSHACVPFECYDTMYSIANVPDDDLPAPAARRKVSGIRRECERIDFVVMGDPFVEYLSIRLPQDDSAVR